PAPSALPSTGAGYQVSSTRPASVTVARPSPQAPSSIGAVMARTVAAARGSRPQPGLLEVQVALDAAYHVGRHPVAGAEVEERPPLRADDVAPERAEPAERRRGPVAVAGGPVERGDALLEARPVELAEALQLVLRRPLVLELVEAVERGLRGLEPGERLVGRPHVLAGQAQRAQEQRQGQTLAEQRDRDDAER